MKGAERVLAGIVVALAVTAWLAGGWDLLAAGMSRGLRLAWSSGALVLLAFLISGLVKALVPEETIKRWLGRGRGLRGLVTCAGLGAITPGGPYVYYPIARTLRDLGVGLGSQMAYVIGKSVWDVARIPLELAFLGPRFVAVRLGLTLLIPLLMGYGAHLLWDPDRGR